jgi:hypothetical protein
MAQIDIMSYNMSTTLFHGDYASHYTNNIAFFIIIKLFNYFLLYFYELLLFSLHFMVDGMLFKFEYKYIFLKVVCCGCGCVNYVVIKTLIYRFV